MRSTQRRAMGCAGGPNLYLCGPVLAMLVAVGCADDAGPAASSYRDGAGSRRADSGGRSGSPDGAPSVDVKSRPGADAQRPGVDTTLAGRDAPLRHPDSRLPPPDLLAPTPDAPAPPPDAAPPPDTASMPADSGSCWSYRRVSYYHFCEKTCGTTQQYAKCYRVGSMMTCSCVINGTILRSCQISLAYDCASLRGCCGW